MELSWHHMFLLLHFSPSNKTKAEVNSQPSYLLQVLFQLYQSSKDDLVKKKECITFFFNSTVYTFFSIQ